MLKSRKTRIRLFSLTLAVAALTVPISVSPGEETVVKVDVTEACADGVCCPEIGSTCPTEQGEIINRYKSPLGCEVTQKNQ